MLGKGGMFAKECRDNGFIGAGFGISHDIGQFEKSQDLIPLYLESNPGKSKITAGLSCGFLWTVCKKIQMHDIILSPDGKGRYFVGEVQGDYRYVLGANQPHQREVNWHENTIDRSDMSDSLRKACGALGTAISISKYEEELNELIKGKKPNSILISSDETIEDPIVFAIEKHLEDFLVANWTQTPLGKEYDIYQEEDNFGQQFPTDTGPIDILAISKDKQEVLIVELKKGRASDSVVGQIQRYMGYIAEEIAEDHQRVRGVIIALDDDLRIKRALKVAQNIDFYRYEVKFDLIKK